jgi:hypothetical protein
MEQEPMPILSEAAEEQITRKVIYPDLKGKVGWVTAEQARKLLGWKQSQDPKQAYTEYLF